MERGTTPDLVGVQESLTRLRGRTVDEDREECLLAIEKSIGDYITESEIERQPHIQDRTGRRYDIDDIEDILEAERRDPRYAAGSPYLLEALHGLNCYQWGGAERERLPDDSSSDVYNPLF